MIEVERGLTLDHPLSNVVGYLADFSHTEEWDPGTVSCGRIGRGPIGLGAEWHNVSEFRGRRTELTYQLTRCDPNHLTFVGRNKTAISTDDMLFEEQQGRTQLTYRARIEFHGLARLAEPLLRRDFERLGDDVSRKLPDALGRHFLSGPHGA
ncbi:SRPBCC family protein [Streptomyces sp. NPDC001089]